MKTRTSIILLTIFLIFAYLISPIQNLGNAQPEKSPSTNASIFWIKQCVDCPKSFLYFSERGLQIDGNGQSHIAYGGDHLYYAWFDGVNWNYNIVDPGRGMGGSASLALDVSNRPHIAYTDKVNKYLKYAYPDTNGWHIQLVDSLGNVGNNVSLVLDSNRLPHISYFDETNQDLKYAYFNGSNWNIETVDSAGNVGSLNSIAIDNSDYPHISYYDANNNWPKYAYWTGTSWNIQDISSVNGGQFISLALDSTNLPHISFLSTFFATNYLMYAQWNGAAWDVQVVDAGNSYGYGTSITLDVSDKPHIAALTAFGTLRYAVWNSSSWDIDTVDSSGYASGTVSLALDNSGSPRIAYQHQRYNLDPEHSLEQASWNGTSWDFRTVDTASETAGPTSLALDEADNPHIAYQSGAFVMGMPTANLSYAQWNGNFWQTQVVDGGESVGWSLAMDVEPDGTPHIAYYDDGLDTFRYAHWSGSAWEIQTVGPGFGYISIDLDEAGFPHLAYITSGGLNHVYWDGSTWVFEPVDSFMGVGGGISLKLDSQGYAHIAYYINYTIKYAFWDGNSWNVQTVGPVDGTYSTPTSLALDNQVNPHICYYSNYPNGVLKYATLSGAVWNTQVIDSGGDVGNFCSIAHR